MKVKSATSYENSQPSWKSLPICVWSPANSPSPLLKAGNQQALLGRLGMLTQETFDGKNHKPRPQRFHYLHGKGNFFSKVESEDTLREASPLRIFCTPLPMPLHPQTTRSWFLDPMLEILNLECSDVAADAELSPSTQDSSSWPVKPR